MNVHPRKERICDKREKKETKILQKMVERENIHLVHTVKRQLTWRNIKCQACKQMGHMELARTKVNNKTHRFKLLMRANSMKSSYLLHLVIQPLMKPE
ncbi:hypothetical protein EPI10_016442 [Gossypium australe]|uniref:Uncharacterized protein n=1 Tax=Gossypium australe TaxID=47621 RepID=A0A5B6VNY9_9ROSI|nr:hypothetical protein EPI10_016442 [Gossypium australe]